MANNRMFLRCHCGSLYMLAKGYPSTGYYPPTTSTEALTDWLGEHNECSTDRDDYAGGLPTYFRIVYELSDRGAEADDREFREWLNRNENREAIDELLDEDES